MRTLHSVREKKRLMACSTAPTCRGSYHTNVLATGWFNVDLICIVCSVSCRFRLVNDTLLKSDVTRRDHVSVVMDAGSCIVNIIVNFIRDGTVFA